MQDFLVRFIKDESGAAAMEYALIGVLIALAVVGGATVIGTALSGRFISIGASVTSAGN
jgi:pilus assembly protein Flp/PilA